MAQPSNTYDTYDLAGMREDLEDAIYNIAPTETPAISMFGRKDAKQIYHEWQIDTLATHSKDNAVIDGDDATTDAQVATTRFGNYTQISDKVILVTGTAEAVDKAGRRSELAYLIAKNAKELKRDMEAAITQNNGAVAGNASTARKLAGMEAWYRTNDKRGASGADATLSGTTIGYPNAAPTDGTQRAITEAIFKDAIQLAWTAGGDPSVVMTGPVNKQNISAFTGMSTRTDRGEDKRLVAAVDVYVSDFGDHRVVPNRFSRDRTVHIVDPGLWDVAFLRTFRQWPLAKTGDSERRQLLAEYTLVARNEAGNAVVADCTT